MTYSYVACLIHTHTHTHTHTCSGQTLTCVFGLFIWDTTHLYVTQLIYMCDMIVYVAVCCSVLQYVAVCCSLLQSINVLQRLQCVADFKSNLLDGLCCNTLQHTATHCNTLQHTATHCNTLQHTATTYLMDCVGGIHIVRALP